MFFNNWETAIEYARKTLILQKEGRKKITKILDKYFVQNIKENKENGFFKR